MYRSHSKDINKNKSFHTLTFANQRKVEILKEKEEEKLKRKEERRKELQKDQEERRYDELIGEEGAFKSNQHVKNIFAAEYDTGTTSNSSPPSGSKAGCSFLKKFVRAETINSVSEIGTKHPREDTNEISEKVSSSPQQTGFVTTSEAGRMRSELETAKKLRIDPLQKLKTHEEKIIFSAAKKAHLSEKKASNAESDRTQEAIRARMKELLNTNKK